MRSYLRNLWVLSAVTLAISASAADSTSSTEEKTKYTPTPISMGLDLQYSTPRYTAWELSPGTVSPGNSQGLRLGVDWITPFPYGSLTLGVGISGSVYANALVGKNPDGSDRFASLTAIPLDVSVSYRMQYTENQILVPFGRVGTSATFVGQTSKTGGGREGTYAGLSLDWGVGIEFSLHTLDRVTQNLFDNDFGVNHTYVVLEYLESKSLLDASRPNLSRREIRAGLRFEL